VPLHNISRSPVLGPFTVAKSQSLVSGVYGPSMGGGGSRPAPKREQPEIERYAQAIDFIMFSLFRRLDSSQAQ